LNHHSDDMSTAIILITNRGTRRLIIRASTTRSTTAELNTLTRASDAVAFARTRPTNIRSAGPTARERRSLAMFGGLEGLAKIM
jgi:hypothetical protein